MAFTAGDTFLLTRGTGDVSHLWVILWGPAGSADAFLAVYLTTLRSHSDRTCLLSVGDHPFIQHDTAVAYNAAVRWTEAALQQQRADGILKVRAPMAQHVLDRIRQGFLESPRTPNAFVEMARVDLGA
jgi:hypothetical protein